MSLPRRDSKTGAGHRGFTVEGRSDDVDRGGRRRRDFTINAIAFDPLTGEYLDPFDGREDLRARDPARRRPADVRRRQPARAARRAVRGAVRLHARTGRTRALCRRIPLDDLPAERIWGEIEKLLLQAPAAVDRLAARARPRRDRRLFPELEALVGCPQEPEWHPEGDVWMHTLMVVDEARTASTISITPAR